MTQRSEHPSDDTAHPRETDRAPRDPGAGTPEHSGAPEGTTAERPAPGTTKPTERGDIPGAPPLEPGKSGGRTAALWISLILGAIVLVLLLIFIIQNNVPAQFEYFTAQFQLPLGVAMLLAAIAGALIMALVGSVRMFQMSWTIRKLRKQQEKIHRTSR